MRSRILFSSKYEILTLRERLEKIDELLNYFSNKLQIFEWILNYNKKVIINLKDQNYLKVLEKKIVSAARAFNDRKYKINDIDPVPSCFTFTDLHSSFNLEFTLGNFFINKDSRIYIENFENISNLNSITGLNEFILEVSKKYNVFFAEVANIDFKFSNEYRELEEKLPKGIRFLGPAFMTYMFKDYPKPSLPIGYDCEFFDDDCLLLYSTRDFQKFQSGGDEEESMRMFEYFLENKISIQFKEIEEFREKFPHYFGTW